MSRTTTDKAKRKQDRELAKLRAEWRKKHPRCMICNRWKTESVHEMIGGSKWRHITERLPEFWLGVCDGPQGCHRLIQNSKDWPLARVLAHKAAHDPQGFDLLFVNETLAGELDIPMSDVDFHLNQMEIVQ